LKIRIPLYAWFHATQGAVYVMNIAKQPTIRALLMSTSSRQMSDSLL